MPFLTEWNYHTRLNIRHASGNELECNTTHKNDEPFVHEHPRPQTRDTHFHTRATSCTTTFAARAHTRRHTLRRTGTTCCYATRESCLRHTGNALTPHGECAYATRATGIYDTRTHSRCSYSTRENNLDHVLTGHETAQMIVSLRPR